MRNAADLQDNTRGQAATTTAVGSSVQISPPVLERPTHNLPIPLSSFIGRERETAQVKRLLCGSRLVTLTGSGGCGKTRLALRVAAELVETYEDGVWFIELAPLADSALVPQSAAAILGVHEQTGQPILNTLVKYLDDKNLLLVLDNCEHVIDACAHLTSTLLSACANLHILATSREALGIAGETVWPVPSLSMPDMRQSAPPFSDLSHYEAIELFVARATTVESNFKLSEGNGSAVAQVCQRLDGIPLAIELAAARVKVLQTAEIAARLDDRFNLLTLGSRTALPRHQTLRAAIDWSYDLLTEPERVLLRRMSVFAGGCTLEAAERVCVDLAEGDAISSHQILDLLSRLTDKSLVSVDQQSSETRYHILETIRQYARERLDESGEAEDVRQRHTEFLLELAENVPPKITSAERKGWYVRFDMEQDNFRAALGWALANHHAEFGLRMVGALGEYWFWWANRWNEGWSWISQFLALPEAVYPKLARANALRAAVNLLNYRGDRVEANRLADESLALFRELGDKNGMAWVLLEKGNAAMDRTDHPGAARLCAESVALFREIGDLRGLAWALHWLAVTENNWGHIEEAATLFEESVTVAQAAGDDSITGNIYRNLGGLAYNNGDYERAASAQQQSIALLRESGELDGANYSLAALALIVLAQGDIDGAASQLEESLTWFREAQQKNGPCWTLHQLGYVRHLQGDDRAASALLREAFTLQQQQQLTLPLIQSMERCAWIAADTHQPQRAARLFGAAEAARERVGAPLLGDKPLYDRHLTRARAELDRQTFDAVWAEGRAMTLDQAIEYALDEMVKVAATVPAETQVNKERFGGLTAREREVAARIAQGMSNREIAEALVVGERTVETHVTNILNKLGFTKRGDIRKWASGKGLVK